MISDALNSSFIELRATTQGKVFHILEKQWPPLLNKGYTNHPPTPIYPRLISSSFSFLFERSTNMSQKMCIIEVLCTWPPLLLCQNTESVSLWGFFSLCVNEV